jgi:hypothetical protein
MIEVLKQMVEALEYWDVHGKLHQPTEDAIQAGKQAIAELESQEPLGFVQQSVLDWLYSKHRSSSAHTITTIAKSLTETEDVAIYTAPPPQRTWVGLTDEEIETIYANCSAWDKFEYERMLEAKLKEKNNA